MRGNGGSGRRGIRAEVPGHRGWGNRNISGSLGKVGNCQIGVSVHAVTDWASAAIDWWLFLPKSWDDTTDAE